MRIKRLLLLSMAISAAGCASKPDIVRLSTVESIPLSQAAIFPPPGGPEVAAVLERSNPDGIQQSILLTTSSATPGDNYFKICLSSGVVAEVKDPDPRPIRNPADLDRELRAAFRGVTMTPSTLFLQNAFGPFSYASGRGAAGEACLYAWQQIAAPADRKSVVTSRGEVQIRFRMCDASRSERDLLMVMYGFTITAAVGSISWNPYGAAVVGQSVVPGGGMVLPPSAATVCELGVAPSTECIFAPEQAPVRPAGPGDRVAGSAAPEASPPAAVAFAPPPPEAPLPPTRAFEQTVPSPLPQPQPASKAGMTPVPLEASRGAVPTPSELQSGPSAPSSAPAVPSPSGLARDTSQAGGEEAGASDRVASAAMEGISPPPRVIELSTLPSSLRPGAKPADATQTACQPADGKICPP